MRPRTPKFGPLAIGPLSVPELSCPGCGLVVVIFASFLPPAGQLGPFSGSLDNGGESLELVTHTGRLMDRLNFGDSGKWPVVADGSGSERPR